MQLLNRNLTEWMHSIGWNVTGQTDNNGRRGMDVNEISDFWIQHAYNVMFDNMGVTARVKPKSLLKFGNTTNADSGEMAEIMTLPGATQYLETDAVGNSIDTISSASAADTQSVVIEGHTVSGSDLTFVSQPAVLNGQNKVVLTTPLNKVSRLYNSNSGALAGPVYCYEDDTISAGVPDTDAKVHIMIAAGKDQSQKAKTSFSSVDCGVITQVYAGIKKSAGTVNVDIELQIREFGKTWREKFPLTLRTTSLPSMVIELRPYIIVPQNADVRLVATSNSANVEVSAFFNALLLTLQT